jgi:hypothetical protein
VFALLLRAFSWSLGFRIRSVGPVLVRFIVGLILVLFFALAVLFLHWVVVRFTWWTALVIIIVVRVGLFRPKTRAVAAIVRGIRVAASAYRDRSGSIARTATVTSATVTPATAAILRVNSCLSASGTTHAASIALALLLDVAGVLNVVFL